MASRYGACPYCGGEADADEVDIGVGMQQVGPVGCPSCFAYMDDKGQWQPGPEGYDPNDTNLAPFGSEEEEF